MNEPSGKGEDGGQMLGHNGSSGLPQSASFFIDWTLEEQLEDLFQISATTKKEEGGYETCTFSFY